MTNITLSIHNSPENIIFDLIEHYVHPEAKDLLNSKIFTGGQIISIMMILVTNGYLLKFIMSQPTKTFLDWLVVLDTSLCISNIVTVTMIGQRINIFCHFISDFSFFINICNRLLTAGIVIYRYVFVIKNNLVRTTGQRRTLETLIFGSILLMSSILTALGEYYKDFSLQYLSKLDKSNFQL